MISIIIVTATVLVILGICLSVLFQIRLSSLGSLQNKTISVDKKINPGLTLYSETLNLVGRPDYLIKESGKIIPVEVKTGKTPAFPHRNHVMQLMAYCYLVEENLGIRPPGGYIRYPGGEYKVSYTDKTKQELEKLVAEVSESKRKNKEFFCHHPYHNDLRQ